MAEYLGAGSSQQRPGNTGQQHDGRERDIENLTQDERGARENIQCAVLQGFLGKAEERLDHDGDDGGGDAVENPGNSGDLPFGGG